MMLVQETNGDEVNMGDMNGAANSDIFVMSNTTFEEDMNSMSSRRVSAGR